MEKRQLEKILPLLKMGKQSMQILEGVCIDAAGLEATNLNMTLRYQADKIADKPCVINTQSLLAAVADLQPGTDVRIATNCTTAMIGLTKVPIMPVEDWPHFDPPHGTATIHVERSKLIETLGFLAPAMSTDETRPHINGIGVMPDGRWAATDGHRLHAMPTGFSALFASPLILPAEFVHRSMKILNLEKNEEMVLLTHEYIKPKKEGESPTSRIQLTIGPWSLTATLIDAEYPPIDQVIPSQSDRNFTCNVADIIRIGKVVKALSSERIMGVKLTSVNDGLELLAENAITEASTTQLIPGTWAGDDDPIKIGVNLAYILQFVAGIKGTVTLGISGKLDPIVLR